MIIAAFSRATASTPFAVDAVHEEGSSMIRSVSCASVAANAHEALHDDHPTEEVVDMMAVDLEALAVVVAPCSLTWILHALELQLRHLGEELV